MTEHALHNKMLSILRTAGFRELRHPGRRSGLRDLDAPTLQKMTSDALFLFAKTKDRSDARMVERLCWSLCRLLPLELPHAG
jgi:hypothetical protein